MHQGSPGVLRIFEELSAIITTFAFGVLLDSLFVSRGALSASGGASFGFRGSIPHHFLVPERCFSITTYVNMELSECFSDGSHVVAVFFENENTNHESMANENLKNENMEHDNMRT